MVKMTIAYANISVNFCIRWMQILTILMVSYLRQTTISLLWVVRTISVCVISAEIFMPLNKHHVYRLNNFVIFFIVLFLQTACLLSLHMVQRIILARFVKSSTPFKTLTLFLIWRLSFDTLRPIHSGKMQQAHRKTKRKTTLYIKSTLRSMPARHYY